MSATADIQAARNVLAKWRRSVVPGGWDFLPGTIATATPLINGTAGNPELWDAHEAMFARAVELADVSEAEPLVVFTQRIAVAILAVDERMGN